MLENLAKATTFVLDYLEKKAAILWPQMCDEEARAKLETAVMPKVLQSSLPIAQTMSLLNDEIHTPASMLFGSTEKAYRYVQQKNIIAYQTCPRKKHLSGQILNCREEEKGRVYILFWNR